MQPMCWRVGELARQTGLSIRTLHHYDEIGLLSPSHRSDAGYRLYTAADITRLQQIKSLRDLGFPLEEIRRLLDHPDLSPLQVIELHLNRLRERIALEQILCERLEALVSRLSGEEDVATEQFLRTLEVMSLVENTEKYYTPEQRAALQERAQRIGKERIRQVEAEWPELIAEVRAEMARGTDPASERVQDLARRWQGLIDEFTGSDPGIASSLQRMYQNEPEIREGAGVDPQLFSYVAQALAAMKRTG